MAEQGSIPTSRPTSASPPLGSEEEEPTYAAGLIEVQHHPRLPRLREELRELLTEAARHARTSHRA